MTHNPTQIDLGKLRFNWTGAWNNTTDYEVSDVVSYQGNAYICIQASNVNISPTGLPFSHLYWDVMTLGSDLGGLPGLTSGDMAYYDGTDWTRLPIGNTDEVLKVTGGAPTWGQSGWQLLSSTSTVYTGGSSAAPHPNRAWIPGMYADFTPTSTTSKIFIDAQFQHSDSGTGSITIAHVYRDTTRLASFNLSGHNYYVGNWNHINWWIDSWGTTSQRVGIQGSKYSASYNIYWHLSSWTAADESPANTNQALSREALFTIQEWEPV